MVSKPRREETRNPDQLRKDYELEKRLAARLRNASREERRSLYSVVYDEYFEQVGQSSRSSHENLPKSRALEVHKQMSFLKRFLTRDDVFLEIGAGDCALSIEVSKYVKQAFAMDVSHVVSRNAYLPQNYRFILSDGVNIPIPENSISVAYSNQVMEHLHPDDALEQLSNIYQALDSDGIYICITPNRLIGPADISQYFDTVATGLHLKEYTVSELVELFHKAGFSSCTSYIGAKGYYVRVPISFQRAIETIIGAFPYNIRRLIRRSPLRIMLGIRLVGRK